MTKEEREPLFIEMFRTVKPFEEGTYYRSEAYQELAYEYAYQSIELLKRYDAQMREMDRKKVKARAAMDPYRDYHYFVQGIDCMIEYLRANLPDLDQLMEGDHGEDAGKEPL